MGLSFNDKAPMKCLCRPFFVVLAAHLHGQRALIGPDGVVNGDGSLVVSLGWLESPNFVTIHDYLLFPSAKQAFAGAFDNLNNFCYDLAMNASSLPETR
jgi:hypothetical protein